MTLATLRNNIYIWTPGLNPDVVNAIIQRAYQELVRDDWSFLNYSRVVSTAITYSTGTVAIATDGVVTGVGTTFTSAMVGRFLKTSTYGDSLFKITTYTSPTSITLQDWTGAVIAAGATYSIIKLIYSTYAQLQVIYNLTYRDHQLVKKNQHYLNQLDPGRTSSGEPQFWADAGIDSSNYNQVEVWPKCDAIYPISIEAKQGAATLADSTVLLLPEDLVEARALIDCFRLKAKAQPNVGWEQEVTAQLTVFQKKLADAQFEDFSKRFGPEKVKDTASTSGGPTGDDYWLSRDDLIE